MTKSDIEAALLRDGYACSEGTIEAETHRELHTHDVDIKLHILEGTLTLKYSADEQSFGPGEVCAVPAGTVHAEHTTAAVKYIAGKRAPASAARAS